ncbi:MAG: hypothetical protein ACI9MC_001718 [Kiritimatiellia bacterium]
MDLAHLPGEDADRNDLDDDMPLDASAAHGIVAALPFVTIDDLDVLPYLGPTAPDRMP